MLEIHEYYKKLANREPLTEDEVVALLKELAHFRKSTGYLASCQAATLEDLPKSTSKTKLARHWIICQTAEQLLNGDDSGIRYSVDLQVTRERCQRAIDSTDRLKV